LAARLDALKQALSDAGLPALRIHRVMTRPSDSTNHPGACIADDALIDADGVLAARCDARPGTVYLLRPDQHVCARWRSLDSQAVAASIARALGHGPATPQV
jgi:hypothetical protein